MKKKIAIMISIILMVGTFTACTAEEKANDSSLSPTVSTSVGVSVSTKTSATATTEKTTETTTAEKATVSKETEPSEQNTKTEEKPTVGKIRRLFRQQIRFRKHNPRIRTTAGIQRTVISKNWIRLRKRNRNNDIEKREVKAHCCLD